MKPSLVIIGLGNPGAQYQRTRHNAGQWGLEKLFEVFGEGEWKDMPKFDAVAAEARILTVPVLLVKPTTYMNLSGQTAAKIQKFYKLDPQHVLVLCDDIDISLATLRLRKKGGPGTHNGLKSLIEVLGEEFPRLRIGIGCPTHGEDLASWVLSVPREEERTQIDEALEGVPEMVKTFVFEGSSEE